MMIRKFIWMTQESFQRARSENPGARHARADREAAGFRDAAEDQDPRWPRQAVLFVLTVLLHFGLREILEVFALIEESAPYGGHFRIAQIFELLGLDVAVEDKTVAQLRPVISLHANKATSRKADCSPPLSSPVKY